MADYHGRLELRRVNRCCAPAAYRYTAGVQVISLCEKHAAVFRQRVMEMAGGLAVLIEEAPVGDACAMYATPDVPDLPRETRSP